MCATERGAEEGGGPTRSEPILLQPGQVPAGAHRPRHDRLGRCQGAGQPGRGAADRGHASGRHGGERCREGHQTVAGQFGLPQCLVRETPE